MRITTKFKKGHFRPTYYLELKGRKPICLGDNEEVLGELEELAGYARKRFDCLLIYGHHTALALGSEFSDFMDKNNLMTKEEIPALYERYLASPVDKKSGKIPFERFKNIFEDFIFFIKTTHSHNDDSCM